MYIYMKFYVHLRKYLAEFFLELEKFQTKFVQKIKTHIVCPITFFFENRAVSEIMWKNSVLPGRSQMKIQYDACALHAGWLRLQAHTHNQ